MTTISLSNNQKEKKVRASHAWTVGVPFESIKEGNRSMRMATIIYFKE